jgi:hypothetical protein
MGMVRGRGVEKKISMKASRQGARPGMAPCARRRYSSSMISAPGWARSSRGATSILSRAIE